MREGYASAEIDDQVYFTSATAVSSCSTARSLRTFKQVVCVCRIGFQSFRHVWACPGHLA